MAEILVDAGGQRHSPLPFLPIELRLMIWEQSIRSQIVPRIHSILQSKREPSRFVSNQPISNLLHVCRESRMLYLAETNAVLAYGTYMNLGIDTIYLAACPLSYGDIQMERFDACKELKRNEKLAEQVKRLAVKDTFWLRPNTITRNIAVDAWNLVLKGNMSALEELLVVFEDESSSLEQQPTIDFELTGAYQRAPESSVGERERRCDEFLHAYLGYFPMGIRRRGPDIKYAIMSGNRKDSDAERT